MSMHVPFAHIPLDEVGGDHLTADHLTTILWELVFEQHFLEKCARVYGHLGLSEPNYIMLWMKLLEQHPDIARLQRATQRAH
jgi:hypothetical protein